ncbi:MAG: response regulator [Bacillota bacterium]
MIKVIVVDDEKNVLELIESKLSEMNNFKVVGKFTNPINAYERIILEKPDLVITDVEMPGLSGVELAKKISLKYQDIKFVLLTDYKEYAFDAFKVNALHYIMKPVSKKDLEEIYVRIEKNQIYTKYNKKLNKIITFGDFSVINYNQKSVKFPTLKVEELFALLIMNKDSGVGKWNLINELWDISEIKNPLQNLYTTIYRLRKTFENLKDSTITEKNI